MTSNASKIWTPKFWMQDWTYQSFLVLPTTTEELSLPGTAITAKKWAKGNLYLETSIDVDKDAVGFLIFPTKDEEIRLSVKAFVDKGTSPVKFEAVGEVQDASSAKGASYKLFGWAFRGEDDKVAKVQGSVIAVRGSDIRPDTELGGMPIGTVGAFTIASK